MNDENHNPRQNPEPSGPAPARPDAAATSSASPPPGGPRRPSRRFWRVAATVVAVCCLLLLVLIAGVFWYSTTSGFERRVRSLVIAQLEKSTGGKVDLGALHVHLAQLGIEADDLTIHGKEGPGQVPFFHANRLVAHLKIIDLFAGKVGLSYLGLSHPTIHIIVYPNGTTNQPTPKVASKTSGTAVSEQLFSLAIDQAQLNHGVFMLNNHKIHFHVDAGNLRASISYNRLHRKYLGNFAARDIRLRRGAARPVTSRLYVQVSATHNRLHLDHLTFLSGDSRFELTGNLTHFAHPRFRMHATGSIDLRVLEPLTGMHGIQSGVLHVQAQGGGTAANYSIQGTARLHDLRYQPRPNQSVGLSARTQLLITQDELAATGMHANFTGGGTASGSLRLLHWRRARLQKPKPTRARRSFFRHGKSAPPPAAKPEPPAAGTVHLQVAGLPLSTLLGIAAPPRFQNLGFDTAFSGSVDGHWTGSLHTLNATTNLKLAPGKSPAPGGIPVTGTVAVSYSLAAGRAQIRTLQLHTPGTHVQASGSLGVNPALRGSRITASVVSHNVGEFDRILGALNLRAARSVPVKLHGSAQFHGTVTGTLHQPDLQGHLQASNLDVAFSTPATHLLPAPRVQPVSQTTKSASHTVEHHLHIDSAQATVSYSPQRATITNATLHAGKAVLEASATITGSQVSRHRYAFNKSSSLTAQATLRNASLAQLMPLAGAHFPVTGTLGFQMHVTGTLGDPTGSGSLAVQGGEVYGEPYRDLKGDFTLSGHTLQATHLLFRQEGGQVEGAAQVDIRSHQFRFSLVGSNFELARFHRLQLRKYPLGGSLNFQAEGYGTFQKPTITANLHLAGLAFGGNPLGAVDADARLHGRSLSLHADAHLEQNSRVQLQGKAQLTGNDPMQAKVTATDLDLNPFAKTFHASAISSRQPINATVTLQGPLREPKSLTGSIVVQPLSLAVENVSVHSLSAIHAELHNGTLTLDPFQIQGTDVNVKAGGSLGIFGKTHPIQVRTEGSINMKVAETFNDDITSSGTISFHVVAGGTVHHPSLNGQAGIHNVDLSSDKFINGLSRVNGSLDFNEGRVELKNVTAYSGGGPIQLTGFATYAAGLYVNIKAVAHGVRVRYPAGVTSMVNANMQLQGGMQSLLLSGSVEITHFSVNSTLDLVSMVNSSSGVSLPPNPKAFANRVRLDIHVTSAPSLNFENSIARLAGTVNLHIRGTAAQPSILGQITITEGQAKLAGTTYQLQRGAIYFNNPIRIEPTIDLDATTHVENYDITIGLHGTPSKLHPVFRSSPPLSEQDIFSLLALGRTQAEQQMYAQQQSQAGVNSAANALLGSAINATVSSRIQKLFGGGSVKINPAYVTAAGNATARLTVQQQISKKLTLTYATNVNSSMQQLIQGKWDLTPNLSVLAVRDETGVFSLVFTIRRRYK